MFLTLLFLRFRFLQQIFFRFFHLNLICKQHIQKPKSAGQEACILLFGHLRLQG
nr:MAG TPA: hypothetical protein [Caudoviricetes sp.]